MPLSLIIVTLAAYVVTTLLLVKQWNHRESRPVGTLLVWALGLVFHALYLALALHIPFGLDLSLSNALSLVSWISLVLLFGGALRYPVTGLAVLLVPLGAIAIATQWILPNDASGHIQASPGLKAHIVLSLLAYSVFAIAAVQALLIAYQDDHLRKHKLKGWVGKLPPLQNMENLLFQVIGFGFSFLTLALLSGFLFIDDLFAQQLVHKTVLSIAAWLIFGTLLVGRVAQGWRGRKAIRWTLSGFALLMVAYFGSKLVLEYILGNA